MVCQRSPIAPGEIVIDGGSRAFALPTSPIAHQRDNAFWESFSQSSHVGIPVPFVTDCSGLTHLPI